jgi:hypothetical protein
MGKYRGCPRSPFLLVNTVTLERGMVLIEGPILLEVAAVTYFGH